MKKILLVLLMMFALSFIFACSDDKKDDDNKQQVNEFTVTFVANGIETVQTVKDGEKAVKPVDPVKEGYVFLGWYVGDALYDFEAVRGNVTVTAKFEEVKPEEKEFTVCFIVDGVKTEVKVKEGEKVSKPADPVKDGHVFVGWFITEEASQFDFETAITEDLVLFGEFNEIIKEYTVKFIADGVEEVQTVKEGKSAVKPADPEKAGYVFKGWFVGEEEYDFSAVTADVIVIAKFEEEVTLSPLELAKEAAVKELNRYIGFYDESEYTENGWATIQASYNAGITAINASLTEEEISEIVSNTKNTILKVPTYDEEQDMIFYEKVDATCDLLTELFNASDIKEFEYENYYTFKFTYEEALSRINNVETLEELEEIYNETVEAMNNIPRILFIRYYNIEDSKFKYASIYEMRLDLLNDYNKFTNSSYTLETIPTNDFQFIDYDAFYFSEGMTEKWGFLVSFFAENAKTSNNRTAYLLLYTSDSYDEYKNSTTYSGENTPYAISYEFKAFISGGVVRDGHATYGTNNYSDEDFCEKIWKYTEPLGKYKKGDSYEFPSPARKYQEFLGWYDNPEFSGDPITCITPEDNKSIDLYAKWTELTEEDLFNIFKDEKALELKEYVKNNKIKDNYSEEKWAELMAALDEAMADILSEESEEAASKAYEDGLAKVNSIKETIYTISYELNGGHWYFTSKEELTKQLLADYSAMKNETITIDNFFERSYGSITTFFNKYPQWVWLLDLLKDNCIEGKENQFNLSTGLTEAQVRSEIVGYMSNAQVEYAGYKSGDYSDESKYNDFFNYAVTKDFEYLEPTSNLMTPYKEGYKFAGWYENSDFSGDKVTSVDGTKTLYAKWENE